jgi:hypothetical protein
MTSAETTLISRNSAMPEVSAAASFRSGAINFKYSGHLSSVRLLLEELTMNNAAALY